MVASQLLDVPRTEKSAADGSLSHILDAPFRGTRHRYQRRQFQPFPITPRGNTYILQPFPITPRGNTHIHLFTDDFSRRTRVFACSQSLQLSSQLKSPLISSSIIAFSSGDDRAAYSRTTVSSVARSFHTCCISFAGTEKSPPPAPTNRMAAVTWSV